MSDCFHISPYVQADSDRQISAGRRGLSLRPITSLDPRPAVRPGIRRWPRPPRRPPSRSSALPERETERSHGTHRTFFSSLWGVAVTAARRRREPTDWMNSETTSCCSFCRAALKYNKTRRCGPTITLSQFLFSLQQFLTQKWIITWKSFYMNVLVISVWIESLSDWSEWWCHSHSSFSFFHWVLKSVQLFRTLFQTNFPSWWLFRLI